VTADGLESVVKKERSLRREAERLAAGYRAEVRLAWAELDDAVLRVAELEAEVALLRNQRPAPDAASATGDTAVSRRIVEALLRDEPPTPSAPITAEERERVYEETYRRLRVDDSKFRPTKVDSVLSGARRALPERRRRRFARVGR
jgi:hypothetical protein